MIAEITELILLTIEMISTDDIGLIACGACVVAFAFALFYNLASAKKL